MYDISTSAPGKLFLSGEYAVLEGAKAVIDSVDRRVYARTTRNNIPQSQLIKAVKETVSSFLFERIGADVGQLPNIDIDSTGFSIDKRKLGIGSSAAVAASATGALFEWAGLPIDDHRDTLCAVATDAHRTYQGGKGSGADVATSVYGRTIVFQQNAPILVTSSDMVCKVFVWTGKSASTVSLVDYVKKLQSNQPDVYHDVMNSLVALAASLADAYQVGDAQTLIQLTQRYFHAMDRLGNASGVNIITPKMRRIQELAHAVGGASKPSGAGGGDAAMAIFATAEQGQQFSDAVLAERLEVLDFKTSVPGLRKESTVR